MTVEIDVRTDGRCRSSDTTESASVTVQHSESDPNPDNDTDADLVSRRSFPFGWLLIGVLGLGALGALGVWGMKRKQPVTA